MRAVGAIGLVAVLTTACARHPSSQSVVSHPSRPPVDLSRSEVLAGSLPRGRLPTITEKRSGSPVASGLYLDNGVTGSWVAGTKFVISANDIDLRDQENAVDAFCVRPGGERNALPQFAVPLAGRGSLVRAERVVRSSSDGAERASFHAMNTWVTSADRIEKVDETTTPLVRIAAMSGVDVFAFVETSPTNDHAGAVQVVVRRAPLLTGRARYASFLLTRADGVNVPTSCGHARATLPLEKGDGGAVEVDVAVEQPDGVRAMHIEVSSLWLAGEADATVRTRMRWLGPAQDELAVQHLALRMKKP